MDTTYLFVLAPVALAGLWAGVTLLTAFISGWTSLARSYGGRLASVADRVGMGSGFITRFGIPMGYSSVLNVVMGDEGVQLSLFPLFALGSPPLLIPWSDMGQAESYRLFGLLERFSFRPVRGDVKITLTGRAARMLKDQVARGAIRRALVSA